MKTFNFNARSFVRAAAALAVLCMLSQPIVASAHEHSEHDKGAKASKAAIKKDKKLDKEEMTREEVMREISYLAKKLLDDSNQDTITVTSPAVVKPFLGVCSKILNQGVELTCITPDSQAEKNGLKTGDVVQSINGIQMVESDSKSRKHPYWPIVKNMKTGELLKMKILRAGQSVDIDVTVGSLTHPAYELKVMR